MSILNKVLGKKPESGNKVFTTERAEPPPVLGELALFACMEAIAKGIRFDPQALEAVKKAQESWQTLRNEQAKYSSVNVSATHQAQRGAIADAVKAGKPLPQTYGLAEIRNTFTQKRMAYFDAIEATTVSAFPQVKVLLEQFLEAVTDLEGDRVARRNLDLDMDTLAIIREFATKRLDFTRTPAHPHTSPAALLQGVVTI